MRKLLVPLLVAALVVAGCGGDDDDGGGGGGETAAADAPVELEGDVTNEGTAEATGDTPELELEVDDNYFSPTFVQASPGATVTVTLTNAGARPHTFTVDALGIDEELSGGDPVEVEVTIPESGATAFYCRFHKGAGMQGAFFLEPGDTVSGETTPTADDTSLDY